MVHLPRGLSAMQWTLAGMIVASLSLVGLVAIVAPPNSWDAMEYHMPRMIFWVSNHTLRNFPTPDYAQLVQGTAAEAVSLNTYLLWGSDRLVNLQEFFCFFGCAVGASAIASRLGADRTGQLLAALFVVTIPEAILESSGAMTTGVVSFWTVCACYFLMRAGETSNDWEIVTAALAAGLALLTKGIAFIYLPILLLGCLSFRPATARWWLLKRLPLFAVLALAINAGQFVRAYQVTGTPLGAPFPGGGPRLHFGNDHPSPASIAANVIRQATLHLGTPSHTVNVRIEAVARRTIRLLGQDPDDPNAVWSGSPYAISPPGRLEVFAGNPLHFVIAAFCFFAILFLRPKDGDGRSDGKHVRLLWYTAAIFCAFIVFCGLIRWQPWGSRFHLPLFVLAAATVGIAVERIATSRWLVVGFSSLLFVAATPYLLSNSTRSVLSTRGFPTIFLPRPDLYFGDQHMWLAATDLAMADAIKAKSCDRIALDAYMPIPEAELVKSPPSYYVYPLLAQLKIDGTTRSVHYIDVKNPTKRFAPVNGTAPDCAVVCLACRLSHGSKSDAAMGPIKVFGESELVFPIGPE
jgi:hypothetical protein